MAKFDVYRLRTNGALVVDCQADLLRDLTTRFVVPLMSASGSPAGISRLNPVIELADAQYVLVPQAAASVRSSELQSPVASLADHDLEIGNALDMLISGF